MLQCNTICSARSNCRSWTLHCYSLTFLFSLMGHYTLYKQFGSLTVLPALVASKASKDLSSTKEALNISDLRTGWTIIPANARTLKRCVISQPCIKEQAVFFGPQLSSSK